MLVQLMQNMSNEQSVFPIILRHQRAMHPIEVPDSYLGCCNLKPNQLPQSPSENNSLPISKQQL